VRLISAITGGAPEGFDLRRTGRVSVPSVRMAAQRPEARVTAGTSRRGVPERGSGEYAT